MGNETSQPSNKLYFPGIIVTSIDYQEEPAPNRPNRVTFAEYTVGNEDKNLKGSEREEHNENLVDEATFMHNIKHIAGKDEKGKRKYEADKLSIEEAKKVFVEKYGEKCVPLFAVHGYNNEAGDVMKDCAKAQEDFDKTDPLQTAVIPVLWANAGSTTAYYKDKYDNTPEAKKEFQLMFEDVLAHANTFERKNLMCHSLGNVVLRRTAIEKLKFENIFMVAAVSDY